MSDVALSVENLSKSFRIAHQREGLPGYKTLHDELMTLPRRLIARLGRNERSTSETFWALKNVSFAVKAGEALGIIGSNGAGKSTLLRILNRITEPTNGAVDIYGRVGALLDVGTGFHPELTGRENIFLNGAILGMNRAEIRRKFDEIVAFAEVEKFLDTPVKRYSSGMYVRLAFAVAAHLDPEILLIDEVLAVGDAEFQEKCFAKMEEVATEKGRTIIFVSHDLDAIHRLCDRAILLRDGAIAAEGDVAKVVNSYLHETQSGARHIYRVRGEHKMTADVCLIEAQVLDSNSKSCDALRYGEPFSLRMVWRHLVDVAGNSYAVRVYDNRNRFLFAVNTLGTHLRLDGPGLREATCSFEHNVLVPGSYYLTIGCYVRPSREVHIVKDCIRLTILDVPYDPGARFAILGDPVFALHPHWNQNELEIPVHDRSSL
jgi:lipopolysaccharide transport system ATP-binding protein